MKSTIGVPGTGMSYSKSTSKNTSTRNAAAVRQQTARASQPKIPKDDKRVLDAISSANIANESNPAWARQMLEWVWAQGHDPAEYRLVKTYLSSTQLA